MQEKGVDVRLAVDMLVDAETGTDTLVLVSSDTDLLPPVLDLTNLLTCYADMCIILLTAPRLGLQTRRGSLIYTGYNSEQ